MSTRSRDNQWNKRVLIVTKINRVMISLSKIKAFPSKACYQLLFREEVEQSHHCSSWIAIGKATLRMKAQDYPDA